MWLLIIWREKNQKNQAIHLHKMHTTHPSAQLIHPIYYFLATSSDIQNIPTFGLAQLITPTNRIFVQLA